MARHGRGARSRTLAAAVLVRAGTPELLPLHSVLSPVITRADRAHAPRERRRVGTPTRARAWSPPTRTQHETRSRNRAGLAHASARAATGPRARGTRRRP